MSKSMKVGGGAKTLAHVEAYVDDATGRAEASGAGKASAWDCAYCAAVAVFGSSGEGDARCRLMADYVVAKLDEVG